MTGRDWFADLDAGRPIPRSVAEGLRKTLMADPSYRNARHPQHSRTSHEVARLAHVIAGEPVPQAIQRRASTLGRGELRSEYLSANWHAYTDPRHPDHEAVSRAAQQMAVDEAGAAGQEKV